MVSSRLPAPRSDAPPAIRSLRRLTLALVGVAVAMVAGTAETENAVANGDTRSLSIYHTHTQESATVTFKRDGRYDRAALDQLNWLLRDWRLDEPTKMDPRLFDTVWEAYRQVGASQPIHVVSAYRSPGTNAMLRRRSKAVAEHSQHMLGKAMDFYLPDVSIDRIREVGFRMSRGGVGWYPHAGNPFIHLDVGSVRSWPRMSPDQLARVFPDGRTVHLSTAGPMARYEEAKAEILARGGTVAGITTQVASGEDEDGPGLFSFLANLFSSRSTPTPAPAPVAVAKRGRPAAVAVASADPQDMTGARAALAYAAPSGENALLRQAEKAPVAAPRPDARALLTGEAAPPAEAAAQPAVEAPLPPRRPTEFAALALAAASAPVTAPMAAPLPPPRPVRLALLDPGMANLAPAAAPAIPPVLRGSLIAPDADDRAQLRALFASVGAGPNAAPASRAAPVRVTATQVRDGAPDAVVAAAPGPLATRFKTRSPGDDLAASRFTGSATRPVPGAR
ncbi:DUF882 domain-containing protein [Methylobacterium sp. NEAU 140]|uniref:DUF882 domain-containing protein n=1 Tax=Methylobacterium sp. NEAU 140 TaxID=3064945 RepID=UPI0027357119|nr:DUF882 domain-containing protein [Methylobacterium sp. NEAU 140]MDP4021287.1 DUF882 domain-containing protein [Methylobacterium sp. NEAU 140]